MTRTTRITLHQLPDTGAWHEQCGACLIGDPSKRARATAYALVVSRGALWETGLCTDCAGRWARRKGVYDQRPAAAAPTLELEVPAAGDAARREPYRTPHEPYRG